MSNTALFRKLAVLILVVTAARAWADEGQAGTTQAEPGLSRPTAALANQPSAEDTQYDQLLAAKRPALVAVKYVQKLQTRMGERELENEINAVMVGPHGLVMCSNMLMGGSRGRGARMVPTDIKILIGDDTEGVEADFLARDSELDLAWLQIKEPADEPYAYLDLDGAAEDPAIPSRGQRVLALGVMGRYFGREVLVSEGVIAGRTNKPRKLYVVRGGIDTDPGLPIFTADGQLVGIGCIQQPDPDEISGSVRNLTARGSGLVLPVETVFKATQQARQIREQEAGETDEDGGEPEAGEQAGAEQPANPESE